MTGTFEGKVAMRSYLQACRFLSQSIEAGLDLPTKHLPVFDARVYEVDVADVIALDGVCGDSRNGEECPPFAPFESVFVGFTGGIDVSHRRSMWDKFKLDVVSACITGISVRSEFAAAWIDIAGYTDKGNLAVSVMPFLLYAEGEWNDAEECAVGVDVALGICQMLHAHQREHKVTAGMRAEARKASKGHKRIIPKPYYVIHPGSHYCVPKVRRKLPKRVMNGLAYRHDRMSHERVLVHRGDELRAEDRDKILERGYRVYDDSNSKIPAPDLHRLISREHRMRQPGEWLAIKSVQVSACVVGSEDLPYVPAVRTMK